ncbi:TIGR04282 family arsenosugar biosynthesis glycosyltransferase [Amycolatopsis suaedae]|uniref:DUF2064 domain-containing protein n=1 Tax=Amycolatopsis suaedae TaxID=2510978 RepID=A0A4Q7J9E8_9PSEU|nr:DUF2064 domain-containing protein [Amycolatopsis suaedae]RZQ63628.1 DUF2064 domain-containing protein [Amycolatopsis suaedae]
MPFCLLVVAKAPVPGLAKTRLCPPATPGQAAAIAAAALLDTLDAVLATPGAVPLVAATGDLDAAAHAQDLHRLLRGVQVVPQRGRTFAERLAAAHADAAVLHPGLPVLQIGMDTPQATADVLAATAACLTDADAVLGPATDGGWWALGLRDPRHAAALSGVPMSRPDTANHTRAALAGIDLTLAATLSDVDTMADARRVADALPGSRFARAVASV